MSKKEFTKEQLHEMIQDKSNYNFFDSIFSNKKDPRWFVPKYKAWMGWTLNFAHKKSYLVLFWISAISLGIIWFVKQLNQ